MSDSRDLELIIKQQIPLIVIESFDEPRVLQLMTELAGKTVRKLFRWSVTDGLVTGASTQYRLEPHMNEPQAMLEHVRTFNDETIIVLCDIDPYLSNPEMLRLLKDIALYHQNLTLILLSHQFELPASLKRYSAHFTLSFPTAEEIQKIIFAEAKRWQKQTGKRVTTDQKTLDSIKHNLHGLTHGDVRHLVRGAIVDDGAITLDDVPAMNKTKFDLMNMQGVLHYEFDTAQYGQVGGLRVLKKWLEERQSALTHTDDIVDIPKGVMLFGVQGGGKSLAAKAIAGVFNLPLLRLDIGALYNKFHGETERNLRETLALADNVAPCVLWLDEIEKALAQGDSQGTSQRLLGTLLTWMAERRSRVFIVATSNDITKLPPELIRKGRLDELFFVDLPNENVRALIADIHLKKRKLQLPQPDLERIAKASEQFTGAEIEQAIVSAIYRVRADKTRFDAAYVLKAIANTAPIAITRAEDIAELRRWSKGRAVLAH